MGFNSVFKGLNLQREYLGLFFCSEIVNSHRNVTRILKSLVNTSSTAIEIACPYQEEEAIALGDIIC